MKVSDFRYAGIGSLAVLLMFLGYWLDSAGLPSLGKLAFIIAFPVLLFSLALHSGMMKRLFWGYHKKD